jgi:hypothetical protein
MNAHPDKVLTSRAHDVGDRIADSLYGTPAISPNPLAPVPDIHLELWRDGKVVARFTLDEYAEKEDLTRAEIIAVSEAVVFGGCAVPHTSDVVKEARKCPLCGSYTARACAAGTANGETHANCMWMPEPLTPFESARHREFWAERFDELRDDLRMNG